MKKSILNIILLVLVATNTILTGILVFVLIKPMQDTNNLVDRICQVLDIETEMGEEVDLKNIPIDDLHYYNLEEKLTIQLKEDNDKKTHYAVLYPALTLYKKHPDYEKYVNELPNQKPVITQHIQDVIQQHTYDEMISNPEKIREEAVKDLQELYGSKFIVEVIFDKTTLQ